ncbi:MurR/RpiR family transcriptional regulator [Bacillus kwashiorkori]|uniref:MurR/RpiR family transcriptional regulator n=1 Tax=Bacillus kwashiorkori TaxID=1522318 RepID=UPI00078293D4|nr:MurR/RpiR family transcriptional regulator [Bacillus kwashiorkori]
MKNLLENYDEMTASEKKVLSYIMENTKIIPYLKINELADVTFVSKTVIINLAQKLGFSGFKELKYYMSSLVKEDIKTKENEDFSFREMLKETVDKTFTLINENDLKISAEEILAAKNVFIMARGTSKAVGYYLEHLLLSIGVQCIFIKDYNLSELFTNFVTENDLVIFISLSGNTAKIVETAQKVKIKNANMISITSFQSNALTNYVTNNLYCYSNTSDTKRNDSISRIGFFLIIDLLIHEIMNRKS